MDWHPAALGLGWGLYGWGSNPATSGGVWWLYPWVDGHQTGLNSERDSSGHGMNYPGHRGVLLPCAHRGASPRGEVAVSRGTQPALPPLLWLLPGDDPFSASSLSIFPFLHVPAGSWGIIKACYPHVIPLYPSAWFPRATGVQCQLQIAPVSTELCWCGWQTPRGQYLDDSGLSWASKTDF